MQRSRNLSKAATSEIESMQAPVWESVTKRGIGCREVELKATGVSRKSRGQKYEELVEVWTAVI